MHLKMSESLTNEQIRKELLKYNYDCGPVTDTTRDVYLKKLEGFKVKSGDGKQEIGGKITDGELRRRLISFGQSVGPITATNRHIYLKRLEKLMNKDNGNLTVDLKSSECESSDDYYYEPMDVD